MQAKKAQGDFLMSDVLGLSGDVTATRKRPSSSNDMRSGQLTSEDGQLTILGSSAPLSAAIADLIHKEGLSHTLSESPLLARVIAEITIWDETGIPITLPPNPRPEAPTHSSKASTCSTIFFLY